MEAHWNQIHGKAGEGLACQHLEKLGYQILDTRFRSHFGEIDIIAKKKKIIAFVEVKTRLQGSYGNPLEALTPEKIRRFKKTVYYFLYCHPEYQKNFEPQLLAIAVQFFRKEYKIEVVPMGMTSILCDKYKN